MFWDSFQTFKISLLNCKTIRWMKLHHFKNGIAKNVFHLKRLSNKIGIGWHWFTWQYIYILWKGTSVFQFKVVYTTHPILEVHMTHREQVIKMFSFAFKDKTMKAIKDMLQKYLLSLLLMMFYHNRTTAVYKVIWSVIYSFIDDFMCLDYLVVLQNKLSAYNNRFEKAKFNDLYGLGITEILMNIILCNGFKNWQYQQGLLHVPVLLFLIIFQKYSYCWKIRR